MFDMPVWLPLPGVQRTLRRHAGQIQLRRRLSGGFSAAAEYTLAKAMDNAGAFAARHSTGCARPELARPRGRIRAVELRSTSSRDGIGGVHDRSGDKRRHADRRLEGAPAQGLDLHRQRQLRQRPSAHAGVLRAGAAAPASSDRCGRTITGVPQRSAEGYVPEPRGLCRACAWSMGQRAAQFDHRSRAFTMNAAVGPDVPLGNRLNIDWRIDATNVLNRVTYSA